MKIVHLCLASFFPDNYSYQENMLPKFHKEQGHEVEVIASLVTFDENGKVALLKEASTYLNEYNIPVVRLNYKPGRIHRRLRHYEGFADALEKAAPDVLFIHGCQFCDIRVVVKYLKEHPGVKVFVDNHADFSNSATNWLSRHVLHGIIWRRCAHLIEPYATKFYGVLPARVDFLKNVYRLPPEKCELLVMGVDDGMVKKVRDSHAREHIRSKYGVSEDDILIMSGGKVNSYRPEVLNLMEAVIKLNNPSVKMLFFGAVSPEYRERFDELSKNPQIINAGWLNVEGTYRHMEASDLLVFPGLHSVLWEQAVGMGKPCLFRQIQGFDHVNVNGNCEFLPDATTDGLLRYIQRVLQKDRLTMMTIRAHEASELFSYNDIARRAIVDEA